MLVRTEDSGYVILPPKSTYTGKDVANYDYANNHVSEIDMGKVDGVIKSDGDILKVSDSQTTILRSFLPDVDIKIDENGKMSIDGPISNKVNSFADKKKTEKGRTDLSGYDKVGSGKNAGNWVGKNPSQEKMKELSDGKQYFVTKDEISKVLEDNDE